MANNSNFLFDLFKEGFQHNLNSFTSMPTSFFLFTILFLFEPLLGIFNVKALFILGYILLWIIYYSVGVILAPNTSGKPSFGDRKQNNLSFEGYIDIASQQSLIPYTTKTNLSFFCVMISFIVTYFMSLNIHYKIYNWRTMLFIYTAMIVMYTIYFVLFLGGEFQSTIMSLCIGICFGIFWSIVCISGGYLKYGNMNNRSNNSNNNNNNSNNKNKKGSSSNSTAYESDLENMILEGGNSQCQKKSKTYDGENQNEDIICRKYRM